VVLVVLSVLLAAPMHQLVRNRKEDLKDITILVPALSDVLAACASEAADGRDDVLAEAADEVDRVV
jgi:hypothetical protein